MSNGKFTLLQVVQKTLEALNLNEVNTLSDSNEAGQIAIMAQDAYYELMNQREWPHLVNLRQLESVADATKPNYLRIPDDVVRIDQIRYDNTDPAGAAPDLIDIQDVTWCTNEQFLILTQARNTERDDVTTITDYSGVRYHILDEFKPQWWTSFDDEYVVMDAFNSTIDSTLQGNKSQAICKIIPDFVIADATVADMPAHLFQIWIAEVKSTAMLYIRQEVSAKDEQRARRGLAVARRDASRTDDDDGKVKFGRPSRGIFFATTRRFT
jgi:hypothetical protein